jgi:hypothetical protein
MSTGQLSTTFDAGLAAVQELSAARARLKDVAHSTFKRKKRRMRYKAGAHPQVIARRKRLEDFRRLHRLDEASLSRADKYLRRKYGITLAERDSMLAAQGGRCATCEADSPGGRRGWHTDHDHDNGKVRGILCRPCNVALRRGITPEILRRMADYLEGNR